MLARCAATTSGRACLLRHRLAVCRFPPARSFRRLLCQASATNLASRRCEPCEEAKGPLDSMGLSMAIDRAAAEELIHELDNWRVFEDSLGQLRIRKKWRTKNFVKGLELCKRIGDVAEAEGHHPDLHLVGWNNLTVEVWTHSRGGLSENDFILAAKIDELGKDDLLSKKQPSQDD